MRHVEGKTDCVSTALQGRYWPRLKERGGIVRAQKVGIRDAGLSYQALIVGHLDKCPPPVGLADR